jgi:hypothetical protein
MPNLILIFKQNKRILITVLAVLFLNTLHAQNRILISYNEKINLGKVSKNTHFYFSNDSDNIHLKGNEINDYTFSKPGIYTLKVEDKDTHQKESCTEIHLPNEIIIEVSRIKMVFNTNSISFSSPIIKNKNTNGITLNIPVTIETFDHLPVLLKMNPINSAGIGTNIIATLDDKFKELPDGNHTLQYALNGIVTENAYLMFDFEDANGKIQSVSLTTPVIN